MNAPSFWNQSTAALSQALGSGTAGLVTDEAIGAYSVYGQNDAAAAKRRPARQRFLVLSANPRMIILLFASLLDRCSGLCGYFFLQKVRREITRS